MFFTLSEEGYTMIVPMDLKSISDRTMVQYTTTTNNVAGFTSK